MLDALRSLMSPPALVVLAGVVPAVAAFARLFRRPRSNQISAWRRQLTLLATVISKTHADPFDAFLRSLDDDRREDR